jgi:CBS domain-containing protein
MRVRDIMSTEPVSVDVGEFVTRARELMRDYSFDSLPVLDNGRVAGMVTLQDIINISSTRSDVTVNGYMRLDVPTLEPDTDLPRAAALIIRTDTGRIPVVDGNKRLVGLLSIKDIFKGLPELDLPDEPVSKYMTKKVVVCQPEDPLSRVWVNMKDYGFSGFPVVRSDQEVIGMITREDIMKRGYARIERESERGGRMSTTVQKIMSTPAFTVSENDSMIKAARVFLERDIGRIPVVKDGKLVGIIDRYDIIRACRRPMIVG